MADSFTTTSRNSWGSRIVSSISGVVIGILFIPGSIILLSWNEYRTINTTHGLEAAAKSYVAIESGAIDDANNGKLVHITGLVTTVAGVADETFAISANALRLRRAVEMYQWKQNESSEEKKNLGGSTETVTTYTYEKTWSSDPIDSSTFKQADGHTNPAAMIAENTTFTASDAMLGAFSVPERLIANMSGDKSLAPTQDDFSALSEGLRQQAQLTTSGYYFGKAPATPAIGDQKVTFEVLDPGTFSILAQQSGSTFQPYRTSSGYELERVESGSVDAKLMLAHAASENTMLAWILRLAGLILMWIGFALIFKPLSTIADVIPFIGSIVGAGGGLVALLLSMVVTCITIAVAWLAVRPLLGCTLLVLAGVVLVFAFKAALRRRTRKAS